MGEAGLAGGDLHIDDSVKGSSSVYNLEGTTSE